jgi:very-short-patch-repair endonuclease
MRRDPTPAEEILWRELRRKEMGVRIRRQEPMGPFIADFVAHSALLVIEVDGDSHSDPERDARKDRWLAGHGYRVVRCDDSEVYENLEGVLEYIWDQIHG